MTDRCPATVVPLISAASVGGGFEAGDRLVRPDARRQAVVDPPVLGVTL